MSSAVANPGGKRVEKPRYGAPALEKGLDILELLAGTPEGLTQVQIAKQLDRSVGELFRMLDCLVRRHYVAVKRPGDVYHLTLRLFELSHRHPPVRRLVDEALPVLKDVARATDQACHLAVVHDGKMIVVAQVDSPGDMGFAVRMGAQLEALKTSSGRVVLAFQDDAERKRMLATSLSDGEPEMDLKDLEKQLAAIRERGYEEAESQLVSGVRNISFPVLNLAGDAVAAIAVPFLRRLNGSATDVAKARTVLRAAATRLSIAIGARSVEGLAPRRGGRS